MEGEALVLLSQEQIQAVTALFQENQWDLHIVQEPENVDDSVSDFVIEQDMSMEKCDFCFCSPRAIYRWIVVMRSVPNTEECIVKSGLIE